MTPYERLRQLSQNADIPVKHLLVMAHANDPFYAGQPSQVIKAQWFLRVWNAYAPAGRVHLRRLHYWLLSQEGAKRHRISGSRGSGPAAGGDNLTEQVGELLASERTW